MTFGTLIWANLRRRKLRTLLTMASFGSALFLYGILRALHGALYGGVELASASRLVVINRVSLTQPLPQAYGEKIRRVPGVVAVTSANWFGGVYQDERNFFPQFAIEAETYRDMYPEFVIPDEQWQAFLRDRQGCVIGEATARRFGFQVGDRVVLRGTIFPGTWEFNVRAIYRGTRDLDDTTQFWFHREYLEERAGGWVRGMVGWYVVRVADPDRALEVARAIDARFANSPWETKTEPEQAFTASFVKQMGNVQFLILTVGAVVFATLLLVTGNTMAMAVRERTGELGVLKTLGFTDTNLLLLVEAEILVQALIGGGLGVLAAGAVVPGLSRAIPGMIFHLSLPEVVSGVLLALGVGGVAGLLPALSAARLSVAAALRRV